MSVRRVGIIRQIRTTSNSNESYRLTSPKQPLAGFGRIFGEKATI